MTARERERRLAVLEALAAKRAAAESEAAAAAAVHAILARLTRAQLREAVHLAHSIRDGKLTLTEVGERIASVPGMAEVFAGAGSS